jgi:hypothetical protein
MKKYLVGAVVIIGLVALAYHSPSATSIASNTAASRPYASATDDAYEAYQATAQADIEETEADTQAEERQEAIDAIDADRVDATNEAIAEAASVPGADYYYKTYAQAGYPGQYTDEVIWIVLSNDPMGAQPMVGVPVHTVWNYRTTTATLDWHTGNDGKAAMTRNIADATCGFTVRVDIYLFDDQEQVNSAYFTPCGDTSGRAPSFSFDDSTAPPPVTQSSGPVSGNYGVCPAGFPIKGNSNSGIYHVPGQQYYSATNARNCFATEGAAQAAGYRKSKV